MLFTFEPEGKPHLKLTLRAIPCLRPLPSSSGVELTYRYELSGHDGTSARSASRGAISLGTDLEIRHEWVQHALASGLNPIVEILLHHPAIRADFVEHSASLRSALDSMELHRCGSPTPAANPRRL